ncbi:MAG: ABC transporter ATP-binding protein [Chloroflexi bacterium]|nr:ABC transporter ATP-binding protein [Chloroflexota bacterium]
MIVIDKLTKAFGYYPVLRGIDLTVERGQFVGLLGPNGSGKTTLLRILAGLSKPTTGRVTIGGWQVPEEIAAVQRQIGIVSHLPLLYDTLTAEENLLFFARLYNLPTSERADRAHTMLKRVGLEKRSRDLVQTYSRGMQQRLAIARALLHDPAILFVDAPYTGLDQDASALLDELLREVTGITEGARTAIMTTHDLRRAYNLTSHIVILSRGKVGYYDTTATLSVNDLPQIYATTTGAAAA